MTRPWPWECASRIYFETTAQPEPTCFLRHILLSSALALAQEVEANHERYAFAASDLSKNVIIRKSKSPYNNPVWVVDKKGTDVLGNKNKCLVMDFRKLNSKTVADKYPTPNITMILANLGKAKFFTTLDLKSGYHQIILAERDREKIAFSVNGGP